MLKGLLKGLFGRAIAPASPEALRDFSAAHAAFQAGNLDEAARGCEALANAPGIEADVLYLRGLIAERRGDVDAAAALFRSAIESKRDEPSFHLSLAGVLAGGRQRRDAAHHYERALSVLDAGDPRHDETAATLIDLLMAEGEFDRADALLRELLERDPDDAFALERLAALEYQQSRPLEAREALGRLITVRPTSALRIRRALTSLPAICDSVDQITQARARFEHDLDELLDSNLAPVAAPQVEVNVTPFYLAYHGENDRQLMTKLARVYRSVYAAKTVCVRKPYAKRRKLRIGFVSTYLHMHSIGRLTVGFVQSMPREHFEVHVFAITPAEDAVSAAIRKGSDVYHALPKDFEKIRRTLDEAELDILFFTDIGMAPLTYYLAFWRFAPIQLAACGHPVTTGIDTIDYFLSAKAIEDAGAEAHYSEKLMALDAFFQPAVDRPKLDGPLKSRDELGLPRLGRLYMCLQTPFKLHPELDTVLSRILDSDPGATIMLTQPDRSGWRERLDRRFERTLGAAAKRVAFVPPMPFAKFLHCVANADVVLDPLHFGGNISTFEALALSVPVVTLPARYMRGRLTLGQYREIGITDCIAETPAEYADIAVKLGRDADYRRDVSRRIEAESPRLFGRYDGARELASRLRELAEHARW